MSRYPHPDEPASGGPSGGPSHIPPTPRWPLVLFVIAALAITALTLFRLNG